jgi:uracil-DNA glycosylase
VKTYSLDVILQQARECRLCADALPLEPRPVLQASAEARIMIIGQAPGLAAHETITPWNDRSGNRLRDWLDVSRDVFYDRSVFALMPMGFCYPGTGKGGDFAPRPECAPAWHDRLLAGMPRIELMVYAGSYSVNRYLKGRFRTLTDAVASWQELLPEEIALPHPSPRNVLWIKKRPWFEEQVIPALRQRVHTVLDSV